MADEEFVENDAGLRALLDCGVIVPITSGMMRDGGPQPGDYFVWYEDGYMSRSPAAPFESGYTRLVSSETS